MWIRPGKLGKGLTPQKQDERFSGQTSFIATVFLDKVYRCILTCRRLFVHLWKQKTTFRQEEVFLKIHPNNLPVLLARILTEQELSVQKLANYSFKSKLYRYTSGYPIQEFTLTNSQI